MKKIPNKMILRCLSESRSGIMLTNRANEILYLNQAYLKLTKLNEKARVGANMVHLVEAGCISSDPGCITAAQEWRRVLRVHATDNGVYIVSTSEPLFDIEYDEGLILTIVQDATEFFSIQDDIERVRTILEKFAENMDHHDEYRTGIIAVSNPMRNVLDTAKKIAPFDVPALLLGESGVGKEVVANYIHDNSNRKGGPFFAVNCAAIPEQLLETELFGYSEGTFTGQVKGGKVGLFGSAEGGTLFLDEIGDMPPALQAKILRVLETKTYTPVGSQKTLKTDVRILSATNRNLEEMIREGQFREDLYYRLNVIKLMIPPLRKRRDDIVPMAMFFLEKLNQKYHLKKRLDAINMRRLQNYDWPGNVRELKNTMEMMVAMCQGKNLEVPDYMYRKRGVLPDSAGQAGDLLPLEVYLGGIEKEYLERAYKECGTTRRMAERLRIDHSTVIRKMKKFGINATRKRTSE